jgi:glutathione synthase
MVVQEGEKNSIDQNMLIVECAKRGVKVVRMSMDVIGSQIGDVKMGEDAQVEIEGKKERVGLFYFRAGYQPQDYKTEGDWNTRLLMEVSELALCQCIFALPLRPSP